MAYIIFIQNGTLFIQAFTSLIQLRYFYKLQIDTFYNVLKNATLKL